MDRPETLYDLMEEVAWQIEAAPEFYDQARWAIPVAYMTGDAEACGTAFCRAGHMINILDSAVGIKRTPKQWEYTDISDRAMELLNDAGVARHDIDRLFAGGACSLFKRGSPSYVKAGAQGVRNFMEAYAAQLKAYKLDKEYAKLEAQRRKAKGAA